MNAEMKIETAALAKLREPFKPNQISKLPKPLKKDAAKGRCEECGGYHGLPAIHLDYVGHAALTDRLLDTDPLWTWEPVGFDADGLPALDRNGGLWIRLTVCGVTRFGYGSADGKSGGDAMKEMIGDALRNAAMRFGAALDLWHKGDLHGDDDEEKHDRKIPGIHKIKERLRTLQTDGNAATTLDDFNALVSQHKTDLETIKEAQHEWWTGDGEDFEGFRSFIKRRREELKPIPQPEESLTYQLLVSTLNECTSINELQGWMTKHGDAAGSLDGEEGRRFEALYDEKEAALKLLAQTTQGA